MAPAPTVELLPDVSPTPPAPKIHTIVGTSFQFDDPTPWNPDWNNSYLFLQAQENGDGDFLIDLPDDGGRTNTQVDNYADAAPMALQSLQLVYAPPGPGYPSEYTKIIYAPELPPMTVGQYTITAPSSRPEEVDELRLQKYFNGEWSDYASDIADGATVDLKGLHQLQPIRWKYIFQSWYGGQGGSDEFSVSEAVKWPGRNMSFLMNW